MVNKALFLGGGGIGEGLPSCQDRLHTRGTSRLRCHSILQGLCHLSVSPLLWIFWRFHLNKNIIKGYTLPKSLEPCFVIGSNVLWILFKNQSTTELLNRRRFFFVQAKKATEALKDPSIRMMFLLWIIKPEVRISGGKVKWHPRRLIFFLTKHFCLQFVVTSHPIIRPPPKKKKRTCRF